MPVKILIADDHRLLREGLRTLLESEAGMEVVGECADGRETVRLARQLEPDLVILDVQMPDLNGVEAARQIRGNGGATRVLALSMHGDARYVKGMLRAGASGYMLKEGAADELIEAVRTVMANRIYVSPAIAGVGAEAAAREAADGSAEREPALTSRETEVLQLIAEGRSTAGIAERLHLSVKTVETHRKRLMDKLELRSVAELTKYAVREGITSLDE